MKALFPRIACLLAGLVLGGAALADSFPARPVTLMVPYPAGGVSDVIARTLNNRLAKELGQPVIVENLGGASGGVAAYKHQNPELGFEEFGTSDLVAERSRPGATKSSAAWA
jgi:tripartite-type tricarboxylate transporter receptor subunit TctC